METSVQRQYCCSKLKLDGFFAQWLTYRSSQNLTRMVLDEKLEQHGDSLPNSFGCQIFKNEAVPPTCDLPKASMTLKSSIQDKTKAKVDEKIPLFYFPQQQPSAALQAALRFKSECLLSKFSDSVDINTLKQIISQIFELPSSLAYPLFAKLRQSTTVYKERLVKWIEEFNILLASPKERCFEIIRGSHSYITFEDLEVLLMGITQSHPGLQFLNGSPEFQQRYSETVIYRILYSLDKRGLERLYLKDIKHGALFETLHSLEYESDINKITKFFSYEHFYVIYCKFWDLDRDHDFCLTKEDLLRYGNHSLSYRIVDRIFEEGTGKYTRGFANGSMQYKDFVYFILHEEDKTTPTSLSFWFRCMDLDCDELLSTSELMYFYEEQFHRLGCLTQEPVLFKNILNQMDDLLQPRIKGYFALSDFLKNNLQSGIFFSILNNLNKLLAFEKGELLQQVGETYGFCAWDYFARVEYIQLSNEEQDPQNYEETAL